MEATPERMPGVLSFKERRGPWKNFNSREEKPTVVSGLGLENEKHANRKPFKRSEESLFCDKKKKKILPNTSYNSVMKP